MFLKLKIKLIQRLMYWWDVFFTQVDIKQLEIWLRMKNKLNCMEQKLANFSPKLAKISQKQPNLANFSQPVVFEQYKPTQTVDTTKKCDIIDGEDKIIIKYKIRRKCG